MPVCALLVRRSWPRILLGVLLLAAALSISLTVSAEAATPEVLRVTATRYLSVPGQAVGLLVEVPRGLLSDEAGVATYDLTVRLHGPIALEDVGASSARLPQPTVIVPDVTPGPVDKTALEPGNTMVKLVLTPSVLSSSGAYVAVVTYSSQEGPVAEGSVWLGRLVAEREPLDVACVWPLAQGVVRDADGVFFDDRLERALRTAAQVADDSVLYPAPGSLWDVVEFADSFPGWRHTLAIEPILLTQLGEMSDGYSRVDPSDPEGAPQVIGPEGESASAAGLFLDALKTATASGDVGVLAAPYASPSAAVLAAQSWGDAAGQMRLGRQTVQQVLPLVAPVLGAFSSDLDVSSAGVSAYSDASIDHVLVDASVAEDLSEDPGKAAVAVRVRDSENERLTLILADTEVRELVADPWDVGLVCAAIAARLTGPLDALVVVPASAAPVPPLDFMSALVKALSVVPWMRSATLEDVVESHPPGSRPILLDRSLDPPSSYLDVSLLEAITEARASIAALGEAADPTASGVTDALLLAYTAESRWWSLPGTDPLVATVGLDYAVRARALAEGELHKVHVQGVDGRRIGGDSGLVVLRLENQADYTLDVRVNLGGTGLEFPDGSALGVSLEPGVSELPLSVAAGESPHELQVELLAGGREVDRWSGSVEFVTASDLWPWIVGGIVLVGAMVVFVVFRRARGARRKKSRSRGQDGLRSGNGMSD